jgi:hypothetical protein
MATHNSPRDINRRHDHDLVNMISIDDIVNGMCVVCGSLFLYVACILIFLYVFHYHVGINSGDEKKEITATHAARQILCGERNPPIDILINANVVPKLIEFLSRVSKYVLS